MENLNRLKAVFSEQNKTRKCLAVLIGKTNYIISNWSHNSIISDFQRLETTGLLDVYKRDLLTPNK